MTLTRKQKRLLALLAVVLILAWYPMKWKFFPPGGTPVDTTNWQTYCVGRFLIDLPPDAKVSIDSGEIWGDTIVWRQDLTPENLQQVVNKKAEALKLVKREELPGLQYIDSFSLPGGGMALHYWKKPHSTAMTIMESYYITPEGRILVQAAEVGKSRFDVGKKLAIELAGTLRARDDWDPIPTEPGFCFPGGFSKHTGEWRSERANLKAQFPDHPGVSLAFDLWGTGINGGGLTENIPAPALALRQATPGVNILRYGDITLTGGIPAQEIVETGFDQYGKTYNFTLKAPSKENRLDRPRLWLKLVNNWNRHEGPSDPFDSNDQALGLWEAIKKSIRLRPGAM